MKTMTCRQLGGACDLTFSANTFEEMAAQSQKHGMEMHKQQDAAHLAAMKEMGELMKQPGAMEEWQAERKKEFNALPED